MDLKTLIIDHLKESGFEVDKWKYTWRTPVDNMHTCAYHHFSIIPGVQKLIIVCTKDGGQIRLQGVLDDFNIVLDIKNPKSLDILVEKLRGLYIWMKNIKPDWNGHTINESSGFSSGISIGDSR